MAAVTTQPPAPEMGATEKQWKDADGNINNLDMGPNSVGKKKRPSWDEVSQASVALLKQIRKKDMTELKSLSNPPQAVKILLDAALVCFKLDSNPEAKRDPWTYARKHLLCFHHHRPAPGQISTLITRFVEFDPTTIDAEMMKKLASIVEEHEMVFEAEKMNNVSRACGGMCAWVKDVYEYGSRMAEVE